MFTEYYWNIFMLFFKKLKNTILNVRKVYSEKQFIANKFFS